MAEAQETHTAFALLWGQGDLRGHKKIIPNEEKFQCLKR